MENDLLGGWSWTHPAKPLRTSTLTRETPHEANITGVLTFDEARRVAVNDAKLPEVLGAK
jgi:hypothetical protein